MIRIGIVTAICWSAIVALAWRLANARIALCAEYLEGKGTPTCLIRTTATRDNVLVWGATGLLIILVVAMLAVAIWPVRFSWSGTKRTAPGTNASKQLFVE